MFDGIGPDFGIRMHPLRRLVSVEPIHVFGPTIHDRLFSAIIVWGLSARAKSDRTRADISLICLPIVATIQVKDEDRRADREIFEFQKKLCTRGNHAPRSASR